jgi:uncharacterized pyridoxamine 5'-phosphate oxidase family protein
MNHEEYIAPFNELGVVEDIRGTDIWKLHQKAFSGNWTQSDKDRIFEGIRGNSFFKDSIPLQGVKFNFRPVMKKFWVKTKYGDIYEFYAPNKTSIRNSQYIGNDVKKIIEVE